HAQSHTTTPPTLTAPPPPPPRPPPASTRTTPMRLPLLTSLVALTLSTSLWAFDAVVTIKKVDAEKGVLSIHANGQDRTVTIDKDVKVLGADGKPLPDGLKAKELKEGAEVTITVERTDGGPIIKAIRLGKPPASDAKETGRSSVGLKPLTEMTAADRYKGEDGGLYGGGRNQPPRGS